MGSRPLASVVCEFLIVNYSVFIFKNVNAPNCFLLEAIAVQIIKDNFLIDYSHKTFSSYVPYQRMKDLDKIVIGQHSHVNILFTGVEYRMFWIDNVNIFILRNIRK